MGKNRFGICEWVMPVSGAEAIRLAGDIGFDGIQLTERGGLEAGHPLREKKLQQEYLKAADETCITLQAMHLWSLCRLAGMIHPVDSPAGKIATECINIAVDICYALNISTLMLTSGFICNIKNETDFCNFGQHLMNACDIAGEREIQVVFESTLPALRIQQMIEKVGNGLMVCFDIFNPIRFHYSKPENEIVQFGRSVIHHFHVKDGPQDMVGCSLLGDGAGGFQKVIEAINTVGFTGWFVSENYYCEFPLNKQGSFVELARKDLKTMRQALRGL